MDLFFGTFSAHYSNALASFKTAIYGELRFNEKIGPERGKLGYRWKNMGSDSRTNQINQSGKNISTCFRRISLTYL